MAAKPDAPPKPCRRSPPNVAFETIASDRASRSQAVAHAKWASQSLV
jgi:hypothetical protein